jgi:hypothetical protein
MKVDCKFFIRNKVWNLYYVKRLDVFLILVNDCRVELVGSGTKVSIQFGLGYEKREPTPVQLGKVHPCRTLESNKITYHNFDWCNKLTDHCLPDSNRKIWNPSREASQQKDFVRSCQFLSFNKIIIYFDFSCSTWSSRSKTSWKFV